MKISFKIVCATAMFVLIGVVAIAVHRCVEQPEPLSELYIGGPPVPKNARRISDSRSRDLVAGDFNVVTDLRYLPKRVKDSFCNIENCAYRGIKFDMVNPSEDMSTDAVIPGIPNKRLVFAALNKDSSVVVYEHGGFVNVLRTTIFDFKTSSSWDATLYLRVQDLHDLRVALAQEKYGQPDAS